MVSSPKGVKSLTVSLSYFYLERDDGVHSRTIKALLSDLPFALPGRVGNIVILRRGVPRNMDHWKGSQHCRYQPIQWSDILVYATLWTYNCTRWGYWVQRSVSPNYQHFSIFLFPSQMWRRNSVHLQSAAHINFSWHYILTWNEISEIHRGTV